MTPDLRRGRMMMFAAMFLVSLLLFLPMRLVAGWIGLDESGLSARAVHGSIWSGDMDGAAFGGVALGDLHLRLSPLNLLLGRTQFAVRGRGEGAASMADVRFGHHGGGVDDATTSLSTGVVFAPLPISQLDLRAVTVRFEAGRCVQARGMVRAALTGQVAGLDLGGSMSGTPQCDAGALVLPLRSAAGGAAIDLRVRGDGRFRAVLVLPANDAATIARLQLAGFQSSAAGYTLSAEGRL